MKTLTLCIKGKNQINLSTMKQYREILVSQTNYEIFGKGKFYRGIKNQFFTDKDGNILIINKNNDIYNNEPFVKFKHYEICSELTVKMIDSIITMMDFINDEMDNLFEPRINEIITLDEFEFKINENCITVMDRCDLYENELDELNEEDYIPINSKLKGEA